MSWLHHFLQQWCNLPQANCIIVVESGEAMKYLPEIFLQIFNKILKENIFAQKKEFSDRLKKEYAHSTTTPYEFSWYI